MIEVPSLLRLIFLIFKIGRMLIAEGVSIILQLGLTWFLGMFFHFLIVFFMINIIRRKESARLGMICVYPVFVVFSCWTSYYFNRFITYSPALSILKLMQTGHPPKLFTKEDLFFMGLKAFVWVALIVTILTRDKMKELFDMGKKGL